MKYKNPVIYDKYYRNEQCIKENNEIKRVLLENINGGNILDIGCGTGLGYEILNVNGKYTGIDIEKSMIDYCKKKFHKDKFIHCKAEDYIKGIEEIDNVISLFSLDYMNPEVIDEIYKKLKGTFVAIHYNKPFQSKVSVYKKKKLYYYINLWLKKRKILGKMKQIKATTSKLLNEDYYYISIIKK